MRNGRVRVETFDDIRAREARQARLVAESRRASSEFHEICQVQDQQAHDIRCRRLVWEAAFKRIGD